MSPKYVLTLVHGTWADTTGWVAAGSFLRREVERRLASVTFREFSWTSTNTHTARTEAGARLAQFLRAGITEYPEARHFVVAHSHGGNVALYAMRDAEARAAVTGIATLGTPFIHARRRDLQRHAEVIAWLIVIVAALIPFVVLDALGMIRPALAWLVAAIALVDWKKPQVERWIVRTATLEQADIVANYAPPTVHPSMLAVLCSRGDEARRWLRTWDVVPQTLFVAGGVLLVLVEFAARTDLPALVDGFARRIVHRGLDDFHLFGYDGWALVVGAVVLCLVWAVVVMASGLLGWAGYWKEPLVGNLFVEVRTDRVPAADLGVSHTARMFDVPAPRTRIWSRHSYLRHTAICENEHVVRALADWISTRTTAAAHDACHEWRTTSPSAVSSSATSSSA